MSAYIETHPFDSGDRAVKPFWINCTKLMLNLTKPTLKRSVTVLKNWKNSYAPSRWRIITPSSIFAAVYVVPTNTKLFWTDCNMEFT